MREVKVGDKIEVEKDNLGKVCHEGTIGTVKVISQNKTSEYKFFANGDFSEFGRWVKGKLLEPKYKAGDLVRLIKVKPWTWSTVMEHFLGKVVRLTSVGEEEDPLITFEDYAGYMIRASAIEGYAELKVGDRVIFANPDDSDYTAKYGWRGVVTKIREKNSYGNIEVKWEKLKIARFVISFLILTIFLPFFIIIAIFSLCCDIMAGEDLEQWKEEMSTPFKYLLFLD